MKLILMKDVKGLGKEGEVVNAKDGYARNYLLPKNLAMEANKKNIEENIRQKEKIEKQKQEELDKAKSLAQTFDNMVIEIKAKASEDGNLFGSITSKDIATKLKNEKSIDVDKRKILLDEPIRHIGKIEVKIKTYAGVFGELTVKVSPQ